MRAPARLLHLATLMVAVAVGAHLLMHLTHLGPMPSPRDLEAHGPAVASHADGIAAPLLASASDHTSSKHGHRAHLMTALCMAIIAGIVIAVPSLVLRCIARSVSRCPGVVAILAGARPPPPPTLSRIDAGVLLLV
jgi:hypothetical protein